MSGYKFAAILGKDTGGEHKPYDNDGGAMPTVERSSARAPTQQTVALSTSAANLGATVTAVSPAGWRLWCASDWYVGDEDGQAELVAGGVAYVVPSSSLSGWYAKSASGTPTLVATGAGVAS